VAFGEKDTIEHELAFEIFVFEMFLTEKQNTVFNCTLQQGKSIILLVFHQDKGHFARFRLLEEHFM
jgi:hypothetical protein